MHRRTRKSDRYSRVCYGPVGSAGTGLAASCRRVLWVVCMVVSLCACSASVTAPDVATLVGPRAVFLLEHGRHSSLVLTRDDGTMVRFAYGDWRWYAQNETGVVRAIPVLFLPTQAALGRQFLPAPGQAATVMAYSRVGIEHIHPLYAASVDVDALIADLEARFDAARHTLMRSDIYGLDFVYDPEPYRLGHNSNHVVANWLERLAIEIRGSPLLGNWRVVMP
jgi:hypothetical protein